MKKQACMERTGAAVLVLSFALLCVGITQAESLPATSRTLALHMAHADSTWLSHAQLVEDVRQLATEIESNHPDPYAWGGGKIAFHRRLHRLLRSLPQEGMSIASFHERLLPFVAAIQDGHTYLQPLEQQTMAFGTGLPIRFKILAEDAEHPVEHFFIQGMPAACSPSPLGAQLIAIEDVSFSTLLARQRQWKGYGNEFGNLRNLFFNLQTETGLRQLLPEWKADDTIRVTLQQPGTEEVHPCELTLGAPPQTSRGEHAATTIPLPESQAGEPAYTFLNDEREIALLRLDNTWAYREYFEPNLEGTVSDWMRGMGEYVYRHYHDAEHVPEDFTELVADLPAATEILTRLVEEMKEAGTQTLIVDLRRNTGGSSTLVDILLYFLGGRAGWMFMNEMYSIDRLDKSALETTDKEGPYPFQEGDYNFQNEFRSQEGNSPGNEDYYLRATPTFAQELRSNSHEGYYRPPNLVVVTSPVTFSGGFWVEATLAKLGARLIGVPSGQEGNHFANTAQIPLKHSGIIAGVSSRFFVMFPHDPNGMRVLPVDEPLTYARWASFGFDPDASILLALETINQGQKDERNTLDKH